MPESSAAGGFVAVAVEDGFLAAAEKIFDPAEQLAENDTVRFRVQVAHLPIWYVELATDRVTGDPRADLLRRFLEIARKTGISHISEGQALDDWAKKMEAKPSLGVP